MPALNAKYLDYVTLFLQTCYPCKSESVFEAGQDASLKAKGDISVGSFLLLLDLSRLRSSSISIRFWRA